MLFFLLARVSNLAGLIRLLVQTLALIVQDYGGDDHDGVGENVCRTEGASISERSHLKSEIVTTPLALPPLFEFENSC